MRRWQAVPGRSAAGRMAARTVPMLLTVVLVGLAALGASRRAPRRVADSGDGVLIANLTTAFAVVVAAVSAVLVVFSLLLRGRSPDRPSSASRGGAKVIAAMVVVFVLMMLILRRLKRDETAEPLTSAPDASSPPELPPPNGAGRPTWGLALGLGIVALAVVAAIVIAVVARRRRPAGDRLLRDVHAEAADAVGDVVREVEEEPDPRRAVIRAYDGMERVFASFGTLRLASETPAEFLDRAIARTGLTPGSMQGLTRLYVSARFDAREIDESMRRGSIDALRAVRSELEDIAALPSDAPLPVGSTR